MACRIFLIRHGETLWNADKKFQGHTDVCLSEKGRRQATQLAKALDDIQFAAAFASDLQRAVETAEIILQNKEIKVTLSSKLREINFGKWEGLTINEIKTNYEVALKKWWNEPIETIIPGGESLSFVEKRSSTFIKKILDQYDDKNILVVTHGGVIKANICKVLGVNLNQYWRLHLDNCSLSILCFPENTYNSCVLECLNCVLHEKIN